MWTFPPRTVSSGAEGGGCWDWRFHCGWPWNILQQVSFQFHRFIFSTLTTWAGPPWRRSRGLEPSEDLDQNLHHLLARSHHNYGYQYSTTFSFLLVSIMIKNANLFWQVKKLRLILGSETVSTVNYLEWLPKTTDLGSRKDNQPTKCLNLQTRKKPVWMPEEMLLRLIPFTVRCCFWSGLCVRITPETHNWTWIVNCSEFCEVFEVLDVHRKCVHCTVYMCRASYMPSNIYVI